MKQSNKNLLLIVGFIVILGIAYQYSFSKTIQVKEELEDLQLQVYKNSYSLDKQAILEKKENYLDSIIIKNRLGGSSLQNNLLKVLNDFSRDLSYRIISFKEPHVQQSKDGTGTVTSFQFVLEGEYKDLEEILYKLEKDYSFGSFSHINFERKKNYRLNKNFLQCSVVVQNVE